MEDSKFEENIQEPVAPTPEEGNSSNSSNLADAEKANDAEAPPARNIHGFKVLFLLWG
jgi:hypothetical protein